MEKHPSPSHRNILWERRFADCREKLGLGFPPARPVENYKGSKAALCFLASREPASQVLPGPRKTRRETGTRAEPLLTWGGEESGRRRGRRGRGQRGRRPALADVLTAVGHLGAGLPGLPVRHLQEWARAPERSRCGNWEPKRDPPGPPTPPDLGRKKSQKLGWLTGNSVMRGWPGRDGDQSCISSSVGLGQLAWAFMRGF